MNTLIEKIKNIEIELSKEKGGFKLFALFLREESFDKWDVLISAPWVQNNQQESFRYIANKIQEKLNKEELLQLSRIILINEKNTTLTAINKAINTEHGINEVRDSNFFGLQIKHAYIITSKNN